MNVIKIRKFCRPFRIIFGTTLIGIGAYTGNPWFYLGAVPLVAGIMNFCPLCKVTGQCNII